MLSTVFSDPTLRSAFLTDLGTWMLDQRWYPSAGGPAPELRVAGWVRLADTPQRTTTFATFQAGDGRRFAVPLTWTYVTELAFTDADALISTLDTPSGTAYIADATAIDDGRRALIGALTHPRAEGEGITLTASLTAELDLEDQLTRLTSTRRLSGEQSNTSLIATSESGLEVIMKVFRVLSSGTNPDIEIQTALQKAGNSRIAPLLGSLHLHDAVGPSDAALMNVFLPDVEDAWREALVAATAGESFVDGAAELGAALADVHADLARAMPTEPADVNTVALTLQALRERLAGFVTNVPALAEYEQALSAAYGDALRLAWPPFQRIHGDLHLGQVLNAPDGGWVLLDFEGEPLRPMAERERPDSPARDVAGILRSIDYVSGYVQLNHDVDASAWAAEARTAFLDSYVSRVLAAPGVSINEADLRALVRVFELDKAAYEAVYEANNRPEWLAIPLRALARLTAQ